MITSFNQPCGLRIKKACSDSTLKTCLFIRRKVFVEEQKVSIEDEMDGLDEESDHYVLLLEKKSVGTLRIRHIGDKAKIERVALLAEYRGERVGKKAYDVYHRGAEACGKNASNTPECTISCHPIL